jgi:hypothetical protein
MSYCIEDNFLGSLSDELLRRFYGASYDVVNQYKPDHYAGLQKQEAFGWPSSEETYLATFCRCYTSPSVVEFHKRVDARLGCETMPPLVYRLDPGDHFRCHVDDFLGNVGYTYFLNRDWKWDWGGLLMVMEGEEARAIFPKHDRLLVRDETNPIRHFVSPVAPWARESQYLMIGFGRR